MRHFDDDLAPFRGTPLLRALTAPASAKEVAGEAQAMTMFRAAGIGRPQRRFVARLGTGGAVAAAAVALSGGVAAAYTASLPAPVQRALHAALAPIDIPPPSADHSARTATQPPRLSPPSGSVTAPTPVTTTHRTASPAPSAARPSAAPSAASSAAPTGSPVVGVTPLSQSSVTPTAAPTQGSTSPSPVATPIPGATLVITASQPRVVAGDSVTISGTLQDETGTPVVGREIVLTEHLNALPGWNRVDDATTSSSGEVSFTVANLEQNAHFALRAGGHVHSAVVRVAVQPKITEATGQPSGGTSNVAVTVTVVGAQPGDRVAIERLGAHRTVQTAPLDSAGQAVFTVPVPSQPADYRLVVRHTAAHTAAALDFTIAPPAAAAS